MSVIGQIRKKPWVLMGVVVIALLAFLINPDSLNKIFGKNPNILGKVNGEEITREEYSDALLMLQSQAEQQGRPTTGLEEQAWQNLVQSKLIKQEFEKLGLRLTEDYFWSQLPYDPLFAQNPDFNVQEFKRNRKSPDRWQYDRTIQCLAESKKRNRIQNDGKAGFW